MVRGPKKSVTTILPMDVYRKLKLVADESGWPLSRYLRQMVKRYLRHLEQHEGDPEDWWRI